MKKFLCGKVTHFFSNLGVAVVELTRELKVGDAISFEGATTDFEQAVESMQVDRKEVSSAEAGSQVGLKTVGKARAGDSVYLLKE